MVSRLLLITPHSHIGVDAISHLCIVARKNPTPILSLLKWSKSVISDEFSAVGINFLAIRYSICGQAIDLSLRLVLGGLANAQAQQAQIDLR